MFRSFNFLFFIISFAAFACAEKDPAFVDATSSKHNVDEAHADTAHCLTESCAVVEDEQNQSDGDPASGNQEDDKSGDGDDLSSRNEVPNNSGEINNNRDPINNISDLMLACGDLSELDNFTTVTETITFESTQGQGCEFGENGNLSIRDLYFRARRTQNAAFDVEPDKIVCNITFDFLKYSQQQKNMRYDDFMFLTVRGTNVEKAFDTGNLLIASTENLNRHFKNLGDTDLFVFDWADLRDERFESSKGNRYCYGADAFQENCKVPGHDTVGDLEIKIADTEALYLAKELIPAKKLEFGFTVTGDNNSTDCQHDKDFSFDVTLYYAK